MPQLLGGVTVADDQQAHLFIEVRLPMHLHPGETEAIGWPVVAVLDAVRQLRDASPDVTGRLRVIAIDGRAAPG